jgi:hypothetical protein
LDAAGADSVADSEREPPPFACAGRTGWNRSNAANAAKRRVLPAASAFLRLHWSHDVVCSHAAGKGTGDPSLEPAVKGWERRFARRLGEAPVKRAGRMANVVGRTTSAFTVGHVARMHSNRCPLARFLLRA